MGIKKYLEQNLPRLQEAVENKLEVKLGKIRIKSIDDLIWDDIEIREKEKEMSHYEKFIFKIKRYKYSWSFLSSYYAVHPKIPNTVYCPDSFLDNLIICENDVVESGLHEITHLAHFNIIKDENHPSRKSGEIFEGFAGYISRKITHEIFRLNPVNIIRCFHRRAYEHFESEVQKHNLKTAQDFKNYLINYKGE